MESRAPGRARASRAALAVVVITVVLSGCLGGPENVETGSSPTATPEPATDTATTTDIPPPELDSRLVSLQAAANRTMYAERHGLDLQNGRVLVVVELADGTFPNGIDIRRQVTREGEVLGYVPVDQLNALAGSPNVTAVRPPERGVTNRVMSPSTLRHT